ncbi:hypothetical protein H7F37_09515 [Winogradskyella sp. PAMC22761]|nr:hypothetical protein H7F37_09515 [Winogradskyella sp. PAMC22761]
MKSQNYDCFSLKKSGMLKKVLTCLVLFVSIVGFSQVQKNTHLDIGEVEYNSLDIIITVDSLEELEGEFDANDIEELFDEIEEFKMISFKLICNAVENSREHKNSMSIKIENTKDDKDYFIKRIQKLKKVGVNYYNNKD